MRALKLVLAVLVVVAGLAPPAAAHSREKVKLIASGLDAPRHLAFGDRGDLYVAEAGRGAGVETPDPSQCFVGGEGPACMGATGAITKVDRWGHQRQIVTGLASFANVPGNTNPIGPHGITVLGSNHVVFTNGGPTEPKTEAGVTISRDTLAAANPVADLFGRLLAVGHRGTIHRIADIWGFERDVNPDAAVGNPAIDSNAVDVLFDRRRFVVADAGGNAIDVVHRFGRVSNLAVFANRLVPNPDPMGDDIPMQAVPTSVVLGPDHKYYVSQLTGFPFPPGGANVFRVDPRTGATTVVASGFTNIMDLAFGRDGTLYVLEIDANGLLAPGDAGAIFAIKRNGSRRQIQLPAGTLTAPGGITVGRDGALYVSNQTFVPGSGEVLRISQH